VKYYSFEIGQSPWLEKCKKLCDSDKRTNNFDDGQNGSDDYDLSDCSM